MTILYNCKPEGSSYRVTKFDNDLNVESTYLCTESTCECPAGHRHTCRHRQMLPRFLAKPGADRGQWLYDFDRSHWVRASTGDAIEDALDTLEQTQTMSDDDLTALANERLTPLSEKVMFESNPNKGINLLELASTTPQLGGFPDWCLVEHCTTPNDCILNGCVKSNKYPQGEVPVYLPPSLYDSTEQAGHDMGEYEKTKLLPVSITKPMRRI